MAKLELAESSSVYDPAVRRHVQQKCFDKNAYDSRSSGWATRDSLEKEYYEQNVNSTVRIWLGNE